MTTTPPPRTTATKRAEPPRRPRAPRMAPAERRQQLLGVATELLEEGGPDALRMDALARAAGVSRPVVYEQFGDRDGLIVALVHEYAVRLQAAATESRDSDQPGDLEAELTAMVRAYLARVREQGAALRSLLRSSGPSPRVDQARALIWQVAIDRWATRYRDEVALRRADAEALAGYHLQGLWSLAERHLAGQLSARRVEELHVATVLASLHAVAP